MVGFPHFTPQVMIILSTENPWASWGSPPFLGNNHLVPIWVFPKIGVPQIGWFIMENPIKMDDLGVLLFSETPIWSLFCHCSPEWYSTYPPATRSRVPPPSPEKSWQDRNRAANAAVEMLDHLGHRQKPLTCTRWVPDPVRNGVKSLL